MIRIIRVLEYTYPSFESMERDIKNWGVPANGIKEYETRRDGIDKGKSSIKSAIMPAETVEITSEPVNNG